MNDYQKFIAISRYARWLPNENRRETWEETVNRYVDFMSLKVKGHLPVQQIKDAITNLEVMPSMRALMTAGLALRETTQQDTTVAIYPSMIQSLLMKQCTYYCVVQVLGSLWKDSMSTNYQRYHKQWMKLTLL